MDDYLRKRMLAVDVLLEIPDEIPNGLNRSCRVLNRPGHYPCCPSQREQRPKGHPWPLFSALGPIGALPTAPGLAREFTALVLGGWGLARVGDLGDLSALVVSELATNVVRLAASSDGTQRDQVDGRLTELWLRLMSDRARLRVEVWDNLPASVGVPSVCRPGAEEEHGRGLAIIDELSRSWGCDQLPGLTVKSVWALLEAR